MSFDFFSLIYGQEVCMVKLPSILSRASVFGTFVLMVGELGPRSLPFISSASPCSLRSGLASDPDPRENIPVNRVG